MLIKQRQPVYLPDLSLIIARGDSTQTIIIWGFCQGPKDWNYTYSGINWLSHYCSLVTDYTIYIPMNDNLWLTNKWLEGDIKMNFPIGSLCK